MSDQDIRVEDSAAPGRAPGWVGWIDFACRSIVRAWKLGAAEASAAAHVERQQLIERHQEELKEAVRKAEARGYVNGARRRLTEGGEPSSLWLVGQEEGRRVPYQSPKDRQARFKNRA